MTKISDVTTYVLTEATGEDLDRIIAAIRERGHTLRSLAAAAVTVGMNTRLDKLRQKYLCGLTGTVTEISGKTASVELDEESTNRLRVEPKFRDPIPEDVKRYVLTRVPLSTCMQR